MLKINSPSLDSSLAVKYSISKLKDTEFAVSTSNICDSFTTVMSCTVYAVF